jgi:S-adenosylmethionine/arginine decarboxylase-like enzyme
MLVHKHLIIRTEVEKPIVNVKVAIDWMKRLIESIGMKITTNGGPWADYVSKEGNCGIAAVAIIETSHVGLHVWDQETPPLAQIDIYSCSDFHVQNILPFVNEMQPTKIWYKLLNRETNLTEIDNSFRDLTIKKTYN